MREFHWASIFFPVPYLPGEINVVVSDAESPEKHFEAIENYDSGTPQEYTVIEVEGFDNIYEAKEYIAQRGMEEP